MWTNHDHHKYSYVTIWLQILLTSLLFLCAVKLQIQLIFNCSGPPEAGWVAKGFDNESAYSIMFGLDKCRVTNKVHFVLKRKNLKTGKFVEHHVKFPPSLIFLPYSFTSQVLSSDLLWVIKLIKILWIIKR